MSQPAPSLACCVLISISLAVLQSSWAQDQDQEQVPAYDPCAELLAIDSSDSTDDEELASKQLEQSMALLDDCLNSLLFGIGGEAGSGVGASLDATTSPISLLPQEGEVTNTGQDPETLSGSLDDLDDFLDGLEIELDPLNASTKSSNGSPTDSDLQSEQLEPNTQEAVSGEPQDDNQGGEELEGDKVDNESQQAEKNRQPADPQDEDAVLKQIREAAEREKDPDTKEALWDQYYDYLDSKKRR